MKKVLSVLMAFLITVSVIAPLGGTDLFTFASSAADIVSSGTCGAEGDNVTWTLDSEGTLTISGTGEIADYNVELAMTGYPEFDIYEYFGVKKDSDVPQEETQSLSNLLNNEENPVGEMPIGAEIFSVQQSDVRKVKSKAKVAESAEEADEEPTQPTNPVPWKEHLAKVKSVVVNEGVTSIGSDAFALMFCLESVSLPSTLETIGNGAFAYCFKLASLNIPYGVTTIDENAFVFCSALENVTFPATLKVIGNSAFMGCLSLSEIVIPESVEEIGGSAFSECYSVHSISIPEGFNIANDIFSMFINLKEVHNASKEYSFIEGHTNYLHYMSEENRTLYVNYLMSANSVGLFSELFAEKPNFENEINTVFLKKMGFSSEEDFGNRIGECMNEMASNQPLALENLTVFCKDESAEHDAAKKYYINHKVDGSDELHNCFEFSGNVTDTLTWRLDVEDRTLVFEGTGEIPDYEDYRSTPWYYLAGKYEDIDLGYVGIGVSDTVITRIGANAFGGSRIDLIIIPDSIIEIGNSAFYCCENLEKIAILNANCLISDSNSIYSGTTICGFGDSTAEDYATKYNRNFVSLGEIPEATEEDFSVSENDDRTIIITGYTGESRSITIPETIDGKKVTAIGDDAFKDSQIKNIVIPKNVMIIGTEAFYYCANLKDITIMNPYCEIDVFGYGAIAYTATIHGYDGSTAEEYAKERSISFVSIGAVSDEVTEDDFVVSENGDGTVTIINYTGMSRNVTIPETFAGKTVTSIGEKSFYNSNIRSIVMPNSVKRIESEAFSDCYGLISVTLPDGLTSIGSGAFSDCERLTNIAIPNSVTSIGACAFYSCGLTSIILPERLTSIKRQTFSYCHELISVTIPEGLTTIEYDAFSDCERLINIAIPNTVTSIGREAFYNCKSLTSVTIPKSVTSIEPYLFAYCEDISVTIMNPNCKFTYDITDSNVTLYGYEDSSTEEYAHEHNIKFVSIGTISAETTEDDFEISENEDGTVKITGYTGMSRNVTIPETIDGKTVTSIGTRAFENLLIKSVVIPNTVNEILWSAFEGCNSLTSITVNEDNGSYLSQGGVLFNKDKTELLTYPAGKTNEEYVIPASVTSIRSSAFYNCRSLTSVTIPDSVTSIGSSAFENCDNIDITIMNPICSVYYGAVASSAIIHSYDMSKARDYAIENNVNFKSIGAVPNEKLKYCFKVSDNNDGTVSIKCENTFANVIIPSAIDGKTVTTIGYKAFYNYSTLKTVTIPNSVTTIGSCAFENCRNLTDITIPNGVTDIGYYAFKNCNSLENITIPKSVLRINYTAFDCSSLQDIFIYNSECVIYDGESTISPNATIHGYIPSTAKDYAEKYSRNFEEIVHDHGYRVVKVDEATCTQDEYTTYRCDVCGDSYSEKTGERLGHDYSEWETTNNSTCTSEGIKKAVCSRCGFVEIETINALGHDYSAEWTIDKKATCTEDGSKSHHCTRCGDKNDITVISALGHDYKDVITKATCITDGFTTHTCQKCGDSYVDTVVNALGHDYSTEWTIDKEATCTADGEKSYHCSRCTGRTDITVIEASGHTWSDWKFRTAVSCTTDGIEYRICQVCLKEETRRTEKLGHDYVRSISKKPTVLCEGEESYVCSRCKDTQRKTIEKITVDINTSTEYGLANFTVVNAQTKKPIKGASIFVSTENDGENTFTTDENGKASIVLPVGKQNISAYANGCLARNISIDVKNGINDIPEIGLSNQNVYDAELTSHRMTQEEIIEYGIDVGSDDNTNVYEYNLKLEYEAQPAPIIINFAKDEGGTIHTKGGGSDGFIYIPEHKVSIEPVTENLYIIVHGNVRWQKEVFDVELLVVNNSSTDTLENLEATLNIPDGLSLADAVGTDRGLSREIGTVKESSSESVHWFVCGDRAGSHRVSVNLTGKIMPFNEPIDQVYYCKNELQVWGTNALKFNFTFPDVAYYGEDYPIEIELKNVSDIILYNVSHAVNLIQGMDYYYSDGRSEHHIQAGPENEIKVECLNPGDAIVIRTSLNIFFKSEVINQYKKSLINYVDALELCSVLGKVFNAAETLKKGAEGLSVSMSEVVAKVDPDKLKLANSIYKTVLTFAKMLEDDANETDKLFKNGDLLLKVSEEIQSMLENPVKYYLENTYEDINEFNQLIENVADIYSKDTTKTERAFNIFDSIRNIISEWPVEFVLSSVVMTDENGSAGKIPYSVNVTHSTEDHYQGVNDMTDCALAFMNIGVHELLRPLTYADIFGIYDNEEIYKNSIKTIQAKEDELKVFNAKSTNSNVKWNAYVVKNADTKKVRSLFSSEEIGYKLACDGKNATFEKGVLTFSGPALINFEAFNPGVYTLVIENDDDYKRTYEIIVSEKHECVEGNTEYLVAPSDETPGLSVSYCSICGKEINLKLIDANECESHSFSESTTLVKETCSNEGLRRKQCINCGYTVTETIAKLDHTSDNGAITKHPTCSSYGEKVYKCTVCKAILSSERIEKIPHNYKSELIQPGCETKGYTLHTCLECGYSYKDNYTEAVGHTESLWVTDKSSDCVNEGSRHIECTVCGKILTMEVITATGHTDTDGDGICDNCGKTLGTTEDPSHSCTCICHKTGFIGFIYKIIRIFWKLFKINKYCSCGQAHY